MLLYAAVNLIVSVPIIGWVVPRQGRAPHLTEAPAKGPSLLLHPRAERAALILSTVALSSAAFVSGGLGPLLVQLLGALGHSEATAVTLAALIGPAAVAVRVGEVALGPRIDIIVIALTAFAALPITLVLPLIDGRSLIPAMLFIVGYGMAAGNMSIVRTVLPLVLFGRERYNRLLGRLAIPQNMALAFSPMILAGIMSVLGPRAVLLAALALALLALAAMLALAALVRRSAMDRAG